MSQLNKTMDELRNAVKDLPGVAHTLAELAEPKTPEEKAIVHGIGVATTVLLGSLYAIAEQLDRLNQNIEHSNVLLEEISVASRNQVDVLMNLKG